MLKVGWSPECPVVVGRLFLRRSAVKFTAVQMTERCCRNWNLNVKSSQLKRPAMSDFVESFGQCIWQLSSGANRLMQCAGQVGTCLSGSVGSQWLLEIHFYAIERSKGGTMEGTFFLSGEEPQRLSWPMQRCRWLRQWFSWAKSWTVWRRGAISRLAHIFLPGPVRPTTTPWPATMTSPCPPAEDVCQLHLKIVMCIWPHRAHPQNTCDSLSSFKNSDVNSQIVSFFTESSECFISYYFSPTWLFQWTPIDNVLKCRATFLVNGPISVPFAGQSQLPQCSTLGRRRREVLLQREVLRRGLRWQKGYLSTQLQIGNHMDAHVGMWHTAYSGEMRVIAVSCFFCE